MLFDIIIIIIIILITITIIIIIIIIIIMGCHCWDGWGSWTSDTYKISHKVSAKYSLWQSSPTLGLHVVELFGTNKRMGKRLKTGTFKPVLQVGWAW